MDYFAKSSRIRGDISQSQWDTMYIVQRSSLKDSALLDKKIVTAHVFFDSQGKVERMETALLNSTVAKITPEKKFLIENDGIDRRSGTSLKVMETRL